MLHSTEIYIELYRRKQFDKIPVFQDETGLYYLSKPQLKTLEYLFDDTTLYVGYGGAGMGGKTQLECFYLTFNCLAYPDTRWLVGRAELKNLKITTLQTLFKTFKFYGLERDKDYHYDAVTSIFTFTNGSKIISKDTKYYPSDEEFTELGGLEITGAVLDESAENIKKVIDILTTRVGRWNNGKYGLQAKVLEGFNPLPGHVYDRYWKPYRDNKETKDTKFVRALCTDNPHPDAKAWAENVLKTGDKKTIERLYFGNFDYTDDSNQLMTYEKISDMFTNTFVEKDQQDPQMFISADLAITNDSFVIIVWKGMVIVDLYVVENISKTVTSNIDGEIINRIDFNPLIQAFNKATENYKVPRSNIVYDADGIGHYMIKYLPGAVALHNNSTSPDKAYFNLKTMLYYRLADAINSDQIYIKKQVDSTIKERVISELQAVKKNSEPGQVLKITPKAIVKKTIGHSPDISDAMAYRMLFRITRKK